MRQPLRDIFYFFQFFFLIDTMTRRPKLDTSFPLPTLIPFIVLNEEGNYDSNKLKIKIEIKKIQQQQMEQTPLVSVPLCICLVPCLPKRTSTPTTVPSQIPLMTNSSNITNIIIA